MPKEMPMIAREQAIQHGNKGQTAERPGTGDRAMEQHEDTETGIGDGNRAKCAGDGASMTGETIAGRAEDSTRNRNRDGDR